MAREIDHREQEIADLGSSAFALARAQVGFDLVRFLTDFRQHRHRVVPVEADFRSLLLQLQSAGEGREANRHAGQRARVPVAARGGRFAGLLLGLDAIPELLDRRGREAAGIAEHMRMAPQELFRDRLHHVAEVEGALLLRHAGVIDDLQQEVAELLAQVGEIAAGDGVGHFVGFLQRVGSDAGEVLLQVPGATGAGRAQRRHDLDQTGDIAGGLHRSKFLFQRVSSYHEDSAVPIVPNTH